MGLFWNVTSGKCFRVQRTVFLDIEYIFMR